MDARVNLTFLGAAGTVTGSRFLLERDGEAVLIDAGLFQGLRALRRRNWDPLPVRASAVGAVVVSHAHLDHVGYLPALVRQGFDGPVFGTPATAELARIVLMDSAKLQEADAAYAGSRGFSKHAHPKPLYDCDDVERALPMFRPLQFDTRADIAEGVSLTLRPAGHILGSASPLLHIDDYPVLFSGDLGRPAHPLLRPPVGPPRVGTIVVESTYGDRAHPTDADEQFADVIRRTVARGGSVLIPAFAVDRTEVMLMSLRTLMRAGRIPVLPVYVDSPMALQALSVYRSAVAARSPEIRPDLPDDEDPFDPGDLRLARTTAESIRLNEPAQPCIIVSASGMATGGRILHHLKAMLPHREHTVVLVGYQAVATRGRDLAEGAKMVKMHGEYIPVRAEVAAIGGFSVHADADEILSWLGRAPQPPDIVYVVHGEPTAAAALCGRIRDELGWAAVVPRDGEKVRLAARR